MAKECREFTAFSTPTGHYQYNVMPQGVKGYKGLAVLLN
jgi:hypothetical protein